MIVDAKGAALFVDLERLTIISVVAAELSSAPSVMAQQTDDLVLTCRLAVVRRKRAKLSFLNFDFW